MESRGNDCLSQLEVQLRADASTETPPWASAAVAAVPGCGGETSEWLLRHVAEPAGVGFLALEALRIHFPDSWKAIPPGERAAIYARHLAVAHWFNVWGLPGVGLSETARALVEIGSPAVPFLLPLLDSERPARSYGSEEATMSQLMGLRVGDYAWALLAAIEGQNREFAADVKARDLSILEMKERLGKGERQFR